MVSPDDLQYFLSVVRTRRLVLAAAQLGVDHTTVGRRITGLERAIGQRLFDRTPAGWLLTESGHRLVGPAEAVEAAVRSVGEALGHGSSLSGTVRVLATDGFGGFLLAPSLGRLRDAHPDLVVELATATAHLQQTSSDFDVAVTLENPSSARVVSRKLTDYVLRLYATRSYLDGRPPLRHPDELESHVVIWYIDRLLDVPPLQLLTGLRQKPANVQSTNIVAHWQAAAGGVGIAPLPQYIAAKDPRLVPVLPSVEFRRSYWLVLPREHARLPRVQAVVSLLDEVVAARRDDLVGPGVAPAVDGGHAG